MGNVGEQSSSATAEMESNEEENIESDVPRSTDPSESMLDLRVGLKTGKVISGCGVIGERWSGCGVGQGDGESGSVDVAPSRGATDAVRRSGAMDFEELATVGEFRVGIDCPVLVVDVRACMDF